jgi:hypothetical protein
MSFVVACRWNTLERVLQLHDCELRVERLQQSMTAYKG